MVLKFARYGEQLLRWNGKFNLTAITDPEEVAIKHFADSVAAAPLLPSGVKLLDIGSGAGFPGLCLKIVRPDLEILLIDASRKRVSFLKSMISHLNMTGIQGQHTRIENLADTHRKCFDVAVSRAVAPLSELAGWAKPWLRHDGILVAWKGPGYPPEIEEMKNQDSDGGQYETGFKFSIRSYHLRSSDEARYLISLGDFF
jgi:16S rRNA (guanine527-N7)-methyltransferase